MKKYHLLKAVFFRISRISMGIKARKISNSNAPILQFNLTINIVFSRIGPKQTTVNKISIKYEIIY